MVIVRTVLTDNIEISIIQNSFCTGPISYPQINGEYLIYFISHP